MGSGEGTRRVCVRSLQVRAYRHPSAPCASSRAFLHSESQALTPPSAFRFPLPAPPPPQVSAWHSSSSPHRASPHPSSPRPTPQPPTPRPSTPRSSAPRAYMPQPSTPRAYTPPHPTPPAPRSSLFCIGFGLVWASNYNPPPPIPPPRLPPHLLHGVLDKGQQWVVEAPDVEQRDGLGVEAQLLPRHHLIRQTGRQAGTWVGGCGVFRVGAWCKPLPPPWSAPPPPPQSALPGTGPSTPPAAPS